MTNARNRLVSLGALLAISFAPPTAAEAQPSPPSEATEPANPGATEPGQSEPGEEPMSPNHPHYASGYLAIGTDFYEGRSSKAELDARVAEMSRNRSWRRKDHADGVLDLWGAKVLNHPNSREELRVHARREAHLYRALFLAHTDPSVKERKSLADRIQGIIDKEDARHEEVMQGLKAAVEAPSSASSPPPSPSAGGT